MKLNLTKFKAYIYIYILSCTAIFAQPSDAWKSYLSSHDLNSPVGWATVDGSVTGGEGGSVVTVSTKADLLSNLKSSKKMVIYVKGTIEFSGLEEVKGVSDKTVIGYEGATLTNPTHTSTVKNTGILIFKGCKNIIIRNLTFKAAGAYDIDGNDNLCLQSCQRVWIDHCDFQDGVDSNLDCNHASDYIAVTWCRFRYLIDPWAGGETDAHCFSSTWGGSDKNESEDGGHLNTTFANCWWDEGCIERMPRVRFGKVHVVNCLYSSNDTKYCIGLGYKASVYVENSAFTYSNSKAKIYKNPGSLTDHVIVLKGCKGASDETYTKGSYTSFTPSNYYTYKAFAASDVKSVLTASNGAGATLKVGISKTNATNDIEADATVVSTTWHDILGKQVLAPTHKGLYIKSETLSNGTLRQTKVLVK